MANYQFFCSLILVILLNHQSVHAQFFLNDLIRDSSTENISVPASNAKPKVKWNTQIHDFAYLPIGQAATYEFNYTNIGNAPLKIENIRISTSWAKGQYSPALVKAGANGKIILVVAPPKEGDFNVYLRVTSNTEKLVHVLTAKGIAYEK